MDVDINNSMDVDNSDGDCVSLDIKALCADFDADCVDDVDDPLDVDDVDDSDDDGVSGNIDKLLIQGFVFDDDNEAFASYR